MARFFSIENTKFTSKDCLVVVFFVLFFIFFLQYFVSILIQLSFPGPTVDNNFVFVFSWWAI